MADFWLGIVAKAFCLSVLGFVAIYLLFLQPPKHPRGIPSIPFWVALIPLFRDVDQEEVFKAYVKDRLVEFGAVKIFFGSQWNVLVHRPAYLASVFKNEDDYQKSGNQKKIPKSVLASFLGDNIISSHGEDWRLYQGIVKPGLQRSFHDDVAALVNNAQALCDILVGQQDRHPNSGIPVQEVLQRYTIANFAQTFLRCDFKTLESGDAYLNQLQLSLKREIFKPVFMNFPFLDSLGLPRRERARQLAAHFTDHLTSATLESASSRKGQGREEDNLGDRLAEAWWSGKMSEKQLRDNITVTFVAGQENPQLGLTSIVYLLAKHPDIQERLRAEVEIIPEETPILEVLQDMPLLTAIVLESLRLLPPIGQLINRRASKDLVLDDGIVIPEGTYLGYNCYSTNRDAAAWGPDADRFRPERWGDSAEEIQRTFRRRKARAEFISFHGGRRACLGERFALLELKATLFMLCRTLRWRLDPTWADRLTPSGPICPRALRVILERLGNHDETAQPKEHGCGA